MDSRLEEYWCIHEPMENDDPGIGLYLFNRGISYRLSTRNSYFIYTAKISSEECLVLKLKFPGILIKDNAVKEKVSTIAQRVLCNAAKTIT